MKGRSIKNGDYQDLEQKLVLRWTSMKGRSIKNGDISGGVFSRTLWSTSMKGRSIKNGDSSRKVGLLNCILAHGNERESRDTRKQ